MISFKEHLQSAIWLENSGGDMSLPLLVVEIWGVGKAKFVRNGKGNSQFCNGIEVENAYIHMCKIEPYGVQFAKYRHCSFLSRNVQAINVKRRDTNSTFLSKTKSVIYIIFTQPKFSFWKLSIQPVSWTGSNQNQSSV